MNNKNYKVYRDNVYVGEVIQTDKIYRYEENNPHLDIKHGELLAAPYKHFRTMLFTPDEQKKASDLLYNSPNYPILNMTNDEQFLNIGKKAIVLRYTHNLSPVLKYFGYNEELYYQDILRIRKTFFNDHWAMDNCELFGFTESLPETKMNNIKEYIKFKIKHLAGYRTFCIGSENQVLPDKFFSIFDDMGDPSIRDIILDDYYTIDPFEPNKKEGPIKKLK